MERTMTVEEKIRRAEEIYNRRRENENKYTNIKIENKKATVDLHINQRLKKMIVQIIACMLIYLTFYYIINNNYIFSEDFRKKAKEILEYDISFSEMYKNISGVFIKFEEKYQEILDNSTNQEQKNDENIEEQQERTEENGEQNIEEQNSEENNIENIEEQTTENIQEETKVNTNDNIGGAEDEITNEEVSVVEENIEDKELTEEEQMQKDSQEIKSKISFIKPLEGIITSRFGWRNPTVSTVSKYHTGIDIAANEGTDIIAATNGKVILASSEGAYGNHLKIQIEDVIIIYAHCLLLTVNEGDEITQGQKIAEVGSTGNSTGPHLHFEIRREDRYVNPDLILQF